MSDYAMAKSVLAMLGVVLVMTLALNGTSEALSYDFEFTTDDYATETAYYYVGIFYTEIENTGTMPDTIDLDLTKDAPPSWFATICIGGKCIGEHASVNLGPGGKETIEIDVFVGGDQDMGLVTLTGTMRHDPTKVKSETYATFCMLPSILMVDDDAGAAYESYLKTAVDSAGYRARVWDADSLGRPDQVQLASYWAVLWTTADGNASYLTSSDEQSMMAYLDGGGNLFLASMDFLSSRAGATTFTTDYLRIGSWMSDAGGTAMTGVPGDPISDNMTLSLVGGPFPAGGTDTMVLSAGADSIFVAPTTQASGLKVDEGGHKVVFISFPFEDVSTSNPDPNNQATLISRIIEWFGPPQAGVEGVIDAAADGVVLKQNLPNPFRQETSISFVVPPGSEHVDLAIYNVHGRMVKLLGSGRYSADESSIVWDGRDHAGRSVAPGVYFYRLTVDGSTALKKMILLR